MPSAVNHALSFIRRKIPKEILDIVFSPRLSENNRRYRFNASSIDAQIREKVIEGIVLQDTNNFGIKEVLIPIGDLPREPVSNFGLQDSLGFVVRIPRERLNGRSITSPLSVTISPYGTQGAIPTGSVPGTWGNAVTACGVNAYTTVARDIMQGNAPLPLNQTAHVHLIGENTIYVEDAMPMSNLSLRCLVNSDPELTWLNPAYFLLFGQLCVWACKGYIYNEYSIALDEGQIKFGVNINQFKNLVDGYSDAFDNYEQMIEEKWRKVMVMNDKQRSLRIIAGIAGARQF